MKRSRGSLILFGYGLVLACLLAALLLHSPARADIGVQPILPGGSSIKSEEQTPIQMSAEVVEIMVRPAIESDNALIDLSPQMYGLQGQPVWFPAVAEVEADFRMLNPTDADLSVITWFPLASALENVDWELSPQETVPSIANFQVSVNGNVVDYTVSELPNPKGADKPQLPWASFPVTYAAGKETLVHVSYMLALQPSIKGQEMALYYIFQTGAGWDGPIGHAEVIVNLPYPATAETIAGMPPGSLHIPPYSRPDTNTVLPAGAVIEGNSVCWMWTDLEPGPEDDFAVWLIQPKSWQALEAARVRVQEAPTDGLAWLDLANMYHTLSVTGYNMPLIFNKVYIPQGIEAYQKAIELLPDHPAPHAGLAMLTLAPYMVSLDAPIDVIQSVKAEYQAAADLETRFSSMENATGISRYLVTWLEEALKIYDANQATAAAETSAVRTQSAQETAAAAPTEIPQVTPSPLPIPTNTPAPIATLIPQAPSAAGTGETNPILILAVAFGVAIMAALGYWILKQRRKP